MEKGPAASLMRARVRPSEFPPPPPFPIKYRVIVAVIIAEILCEVREREKKERSEREREREKGRGKRKIVRYLCAIRLPAFRPSSAFRGCLAGTGWGSHTEHKMAAIAKDCEQVEEAK